MMPLTHNNFGFSLHRITFLYLCNRLLDSENCIRIGMGEFNIFKEHELGFNYR